LPGRIYRVISGCRKDGLPGTALNDRSDETLLDFLVTNERKVLLGVEVVRHGFFRHAGGCVYRKPLNPDVMVVKSAEDRA